MPSSAKGAYVDADARMAETGGKLLYGLDRELAEKQAAKFDTKLEADARSWMEAVLGTTLEGTTHEALKSGVVLCELVNAIQPGSCKAPSKMAAPFKQMENIGNYLAACVKLGQPSRDSFQTVTLFEDQDMMQVVTNLHALGAIAQKLGFGGEAQLGVKLADANVRAFTAEQLSAGRAAQTFIGKGSSGQATACSIDRRKEIDRMKHVA